MNRKGELEQAHAKARIGAEVYRLLGELRRLSGHETGEVGADARFTPLLSTVFSNAKLSRSAGFRALADAERLGWFIRSATADPAKVAGRLAIGQDDAGTGTCECGCGRSLAGMRPHARYYSGACRLRAARSRKASRASPDNRYSASPDNRDNPEVDEVSCNASSVTPSPEKRVNPQVRDLEIAEADNKRIEHSPQGGSTHAHAHAHAREAGPDPAWPQTGDLTACEFCGADGIVGVRPVEHDPACRWLAAVRLYEAER